MGCSVCDALFLLFRSGGLSAKMRHMAQLELTPQLLVSAYAQGIFPMARRNGRIDWYDPDPRAIIPLDERFHIPRSLQRTLKKNPFEIRYDTDFKRVMWACAEPAPGREETWISAKLVAAYDRLHQLGLAHTVETWQNGELVGGLYGVSIRGLFAGESMFSRVPEASKVALVYLVEKLRAGGFALLDTQFTTPHLERFGAYEIPREEYQQRLAHALTLDAKFHVK